MQKLSNNGSFNVPTMTCDHELWNLVLALFMISVSDECGLSGRR